MPLAHDRTVRMLTSPRRSSTPTSTFVASLHIVQADPSLTWPWIQISGSRDRNRALDGDMVAVELLDVDEVWASKKEKEDKKRKKEENQAFNDIRAHAGGPKKADKKKDDVEVEGQGLMLFDDEEVNDETKPREDSSSSLAHAANRD